LHVADGVNEPESDRLEDTLNNPPSDEYNDSVGAVVHARKAYEAACTATGADSWPAEQAKNYLDRQIVHRDEMRVRHDQAEGRPANA
jgi:hypothetical protein